MRVKAKAAKVKVHEPAVAAEVVAEPVVEDKPKSAKGTGKG